MDFSYTTLGWGMLAVLIGLWILVQRHRWHHLGSFFQGGLRHAGKTKRMAVQERLWLGGQHYASLLDVDGQCFLVLLTPQQPHIVPLASLVSAPPKVDSGL